ncbi:hypothetical protein [Aquibacillus rhizosphaerae]|uniref:Uncharacterized protein n=1 Tax=Aquibacillus rhizosphaerae TaxID=3051431 RepID=A0ABT7L924_9BACI|nr:hypothetical protein [Aquibacillus sp. LR5S19]MDL4841685.1 hypothetical protein [Aquibacillus sp. LR5S19]
MKELTVLKIRKILLHILLLLISFTLSYTITYSLNFLPNGYEVMVREESSLTIQSNTVFGIKDDIISYAPPELRKIDRLDDVIYNQKENLWLFFTAFFISLILFFYRLSKGEKIMHCLFKSGILAALFALLPYIQTVDRIQFIIANT